MLPVHGVVHGARPGLAVGGGHDSGSHCTRRERARRHPPAVRALRRRSAPPRRRRSAAALASAVLRDDELLVRLSTRGGRRHDFSSRSAPVNTAIILRASASRRLANDVGVPRVGTGNARTPGGVHRRRSVPDRRIDVSSLPFRNSPLDIATRMLQAMSSSEPRRAFPQRAANEVWFDDDDKSTPRLSRRDLSTGCRR